MNALLIGLPNYLIDKLQRVQNCAARIVTGVRKSDHITPILKHLHWLPVKYRIQYKILLLTFKCLSGTAPKYLTDMIVPYNPTRSLRSEKQHLLVQPSSKLCSYGDRAFSVAAPRLWNDLPFLIRSASSVSIFKCQLKTHLFKQAFGV